MNIQRLLIIAIFCATLATCRKRPNGKSRLRNRDVQDVTEGSCDLSVSCKTGSATRVKLPIRGPRGPPGPEGKRGEPGGSGTPGIPGIPGLTKNTVRVAFFAGLEPNVGTVDENSDIVFGSVVTNVGGAYNLDSGRFTAPVNGTYYFTVVVSAQGGRRAAVMFVKNGSMIVTVWAESFPTWGTSSNSIIVDLKAGDQVWLIQLKRAPFLHGYMYSTFSGMLLFGDGPRTEQTDQNS